MKTLVVSDMNHPGIGGLVILLAIAGYSDKDIAIKHISEIPETKMEYVPRPAINVSMMKVPVFQDRDVIPPQYRTRHQRRGRI